MPLSSVETPAAVVDVPATPGRAGSPRLRLAFGRPLQWCVARSLADVAPALDAAHALARAGSWCVGWVDYEAAAGLDRAFVPGTHVHTVAPGHVLAAFAVFDQPVPWPAEATNPWRTEPWQCRLRDTPQTPDAFGRRVQAIRDRIERGDLYQVNLTAPLDSVLTGDELAYFEALCRSQPEGYLFRSSHELAGAPERILSASPELFFHWAGDTLRAQPMKGTAARGSTPEQDTASAQALRASPKERAENLMIVDLLRNDVSRLARPGTVRVPSLFDLQALPTVWQMTSTIEAQVRPGLRLSDVFAALFPCGSVTGAPKRAAMACIRELEDGPRGVYCGAVGLLRPGGEALFNVPIRTVTLQATTTRSDSDPSSWRARCGVGSGITFDSRPEAEAREWHHKQAFLHRAAAPFDLLETLRLDDGDYALLDGHLARLERSAAHFRYPFERERILTALRRHAGNLTGLHRVRLRLTVAGELIVESAPLGPTPVPARLAWADRPMPDVDEFIAHKTTRREAYAPFAQPAGSPFFDTVLWNAEGRITETTFGNLALRLEGRWVTPPVEAGLLPGVYRAELLAQGRIATADVRMADMARVEAVAFLNSVRGWVDVDCAALKRDIPR